MNVLTAEVFDKVLVPVLEESLLRTGPRVIGAVLRSGHGGGGGILFSLALVLDGCRRSGKRTYEFVINRENPISAQQVMCGVNYRARARRLCIAGGHRSNTGRWAGGGGAQSVGDSGQRADLALGPYTPGSGAR